MNDQPLSHEDATALMAGSLPADRPDLVVLAAAIDDFRDAFAEPAPQPSPELRGWLTGAPALLRHGTESAAMAATPVGARTGAALRRRMRAAARALAGLGVAAKIALGGTAALAAVATAGAVGVLPEKPQAVFDRIIGNEHADALAPRTPLDQSADTIARADPRADTDAPPAIDPRSDAGSREQRHTDQRSLSHNTSERPDRDSGGTSQDATSNPPRNERDPVPDSDEPDDVDHETQEDAGDEPDDQPTDEPEDQSDEESDDAPEDQSDEESDDDHGDDGSQADDEEETDASSDDAAPDADDSVDSSDDADDGDAETGAWSFG
jgi:hypothetical protein